MTVASVYPHYVTKVERKGRTKDELHEAMRWMTGYTQSQLEALLATDITFEEFFAQAPALTPNRHLITGVICGMRIEEIKDPLMRELRYMDKLVDEIAKGRPMEKVLRTPQ